MRAIINNLIAVVFFFASLAAVGEESFIIVEAPSGSTALGMRLTHPECRELLIPAYLAQFAELNGIENSEHSFRHLRPGQWKLPIALTPAVEPAVETASAVEKQVAALEPAADSIRRELVLPDTNQLFAHFRLSEDDDSSTFQRLELEKKTAELESLREEVDSLRAEKAAVTAKNSDLAARFEEERLARQQAEKSALAKAAPIVVEGRVTSGDSFPNWWLIGALAVVSILLAVLFLQSIFLAKKVLQQSQKLTASEEERNRLTRELAQKSAAAGYWESQYRLHKPDVSSVLKTTPPRPVILRKSGSEKFRRFLEEAAKAPA